MDGYDDVPIDRLLYNEYCPQPSMAEACAAIELGAAPWAQGMVAGNPTAEEADCVDFLSTMAANSNFRLQGDVQARRDLAVKLEGGSSSDEAGGEIRLSDRQRGTLTALMLWTWEEHIPRQNLIVVLLTHFSMRRPYVHSKEYDRGNMEKITENLRWWTAVLEEGNMLQLMTRPPKFVCADAEVPPARASWPDGSDSSENADTEGDELAC